MEEVFQVSKDPAWHRWLDGIVILFIGLAAGIVLAFALAFDEVAPINTSVRRKPVPLLEQGVGSGASTDIPSEFKIEEG